MKRKTGQANKIIAKLITTPLTSDLNEKGAFWLLTAGVIAYVSFLTALCIHKYISFAYIDFDLAIHSQIVWNILHGSLYNSILGIVFLGNHVHPISFLLAPAYKIFPHPITLLFLQSLFLGIGAYPLYYLARLLLGYKWALLISVIYLLYPPLGYVNLFEFHPIAFSTVFLLCMLYFFHKNRFGPYMVFMLLAMSCQENISLAVVAFGLYAWINRKRGIWIGIPIVSGFFYFLLCMSVIIPYFNKGTIQYLSLYSHLGNSAWNILATILTNPIGILKIIFMKHKLIYLNQLFGHLCYIPLLSPVSLFLSLPFFLQHLVSSRITEASIQYHYTAELIPFIFLGYVYGIKKIVSLVWVRNNQKMAALVLLTAACISNAVWGPYLPFLANYYISQKKACRDFNTDLFLKRIPPGASVVSTFRLLSHLTNREFLYSFHHAYTGHYTLSSKPYQLPLDTQYALIDFNDPLTFNGFYHPNNSSTIKKLIETHHWKAIEIRNSIVLFQKGERDSYPLYEVLTSEPVCKRGVTVMVTKEIEFLGCDLEGPGNDRLHLVSYWKCIGKTADDINVFFDLTDYSGTVVKHITLPVCYRILPTNSWLPGTFIKEDKYLTLPRCLPPGKYALKMGFFNYLTNEIYAAGHGDPLGRIFITEINIRT